MKQKEAEKRQREQQRKSLTASQRKEASKQKKQAKTQRQQTAAERKAEKQRDLDIIEKYIEEEVDKYVTSGKKRRSQEAIEGKRQQLEDKIGTNIMNLPKSYVEKQKEGTILESGLTNIPFLDIFFPL